MLLKNKIHGVFFKKAAQLEHSFYQVTTNLQRIHMFLKKKLGREKDHFLHTIMAVWVWFWFTMNCLELSSVQRSSMVARSCWWSACWKSSRAKKFPASFQKFPVFFHGHFINATNNWGRGYRSKDSKWISLWMMASIILFGISKSLRNSEALMESSCRKLKIQKPYDEHWDFRRGHG